MAELTICAHLIKNQLKRPEEPAGRLMRALHKWAHPTRRDSNGLVCYLLGAGLSRSKSVRDDNVMEPISWSRADVVVGLRIARVYWVDQPQLFAQCFDFDCIKRDRYFTVSKLKGGLYSRLKWVES
jgi:hypothetical protein